MRDSRLDFWRGLCLIDMVLVHLAWEGLDFGWLRPALTEHLRFAAGGFVFVAGLGVVTVWMPRMERRSDRAAVRAVLWRRAAYLLGVHYVAAASFVVLQVSRDERPAIAAAALIRDVVLLRDAPPYADILPLYVVLLFASPALLELVRRRLWLVAAIVSAALFAWGLYDPWVLSPHEGETFPVLLWQSVFVAGALFGAALPWIERAAVRIALGAAVAAATVALLLAAERGLLSMPDGVGPIVFSKVPLNTAELARYVSLTITVLLSSALVWRHLQETRVVRVVARMGRRSLGLYVAHVWIQVPILVLAARMPGIGPFRMALAIPALVALWTVAYVLERCPRQPTRWWRDLVRGWAAPPVGAAVAAVLLVTVSGWAPGGPVAEPPGPSPVAVIDVDDVDLADAVGAESDADEMGTDDVPSPLGAGAPSIVAA